MNQINLTWRLLEVIVRANETKHATTTLKNTEEINARQLRARTAAVVARPVKRKTDEESGKMISLFFDTLNERQRRLYAGLESARLGHGGDAQMAHALQLDPATVSRGRHELLSGEVIKERIRKPGGGRKRIEKKTSK